jgi:uncharacterized protein (TIGR03067 family)
MSLSLEEILMKARRVLALAVVALVPWFAQAIAAEASKDAVRKEMAKFEGTWKFVSIEMEGAKLAEEQVKQSGKMVIRGNKFTIPSGDVPYRGTFKVDVSSKPKQIDVSFTEGPEKGKSLLGIYELEGDTYKVCLAFPGKPRPKAFATKAGSGCVLEVLKREKAKKP